MISNIKGALHRVNPLVAAATLMLAAIIPALAAQRASAYSLLDRSLMVSSTIPSNDTAAPDGTTYTFGGSPGQVPAGDPRNGTKVDHTYTFSVPTVGDLDGFTIEYCETAFGYVGTGACTATNLLANSGFTATNWGGGTVDVNGVDYDVTANAANYLTLIPDTTPYTTTIADEDVTITFEASETDFFRNPNSTYFGTSNGTYFAHISTFAADANASAAYAFVGNTPTGVIDDGTVTNNVAQSISIYTRVQETLNFSVEGEGAPLDSTSGSPTARVGAACTPLTEPTLLNMGDSNSALSAAQAYTAQSYFRLATNSANGTVVHFSGNTLQSGANSIDPIANAGATSTIATEQFGLGIDLSDPDSTLSGDTLLGLDIIGAYGDAENDNYAFDTASVTTPRPIANSDGIVDCETGVVEYVANIGVDTPAGIYTTKLSYIAAPTY